MRRFQVARWLRGLRLLAAAVVTLVCAGIVSPGQGAATVSAVTAARSSERAHSLRPHTPGHELRLDLIEADLDDDDIEGDRHRLPGFAECADITFVPTRCPREAHHSETSLARDPTWFAIGHGFARGPPV